MPQEGRRQFSVANRRSDWPSEAKYDGFLSILGAARSICSRSAQGGLTYLAAHLTPRRPTCIFTRNLQARSALGPKTLAFLSILEGCQATPRTASVPSWRPLGLLLRRLAAPWAVPRRELSVSASSTAASASVTCSARAAADALRPAAVVVPPPSLALAGFALHPGARPLCEARRGRPVAAPLPMLPPPAPHGARPRSASPARCTLLLHLPRSLGRRLAASTSVDVVRRGPCCG